MSSHRAGRRRRGTTTVLNRPEQIRTTPPAHDLVSPGETVTPALPNHVPDSALDDLFEVQQRASQRAADADAAAVPLEQDANTEITEADRLRAAAAELRRQAAEADRTADGLIASAETTTRNAQRHREAAREARAAADFHAARIEEVLKGTDREHPRKRWERQRAAQEALPSLPFPRGNEQAAQPSGDTPLVAQATATVGMAAAPGEAAT